MLGKLWHWIGKLFNGFIIFIGIVVFLGGIGKCTGVIGNKPNYNVDISQYDSVSDSELFELDRDAYGERMKRFDYEYGKKINNLSLKGEIDRQTDKWWRRLVGGQVRNHKTFELEPKAPFYEPQGSVRCVKITGSSARDLNRMFLNTYLMERNLKDRYQGDKRALEEIDQMSCRELFKNTFFSR